MTLSTHYLDAFNTNRRIDLMTPAHKTSVTGSAMVLPPKMPTAMLSGYTLASQTDFTKVDQSTFLNSWWRWQGTPGGDPQAVWQPDHVALDAGGLHLLTTEGTPWVSGGVGSKYSQTFGHYHFCIRIPDAQGIDFVSLLWPVGDKWPPEVDVVESMDGSTNCFVHYSSSNRQDVYKYTGINWTHWQQVQVWWTSQSLRINVGGAQRVYTTNNVPQVPMRLDFQAQTYDPSKASACAFDVAWVRQFAKTF